MRRKLMVVVLVWLATHAAPASQQLNLYLAMDRLLGYVGAPVTPADPTNMGAFARRAPTGNTGIAAPTAGVAARPAAAGAARDDRPLALGRARADLDRLANGAGDRQA